MDNYNPHFSHKLLFSSQIFHILTGSLLSFSIGYQQKARCLQRCRQHKKQPVKNEIISNRFPCRKNTAFRRTPAQKTASYQAKIDFPHFHSPLLRLRLLISLYLILFFSVRLREPTPAGRRAVEKPLIHIPIQQIKVIKYIYPIQTKGEAS